MWTSLIIKGGHIEVKRTQVVPSLHFFHNRIYALCHIMVNISGSKFRSWSNRRPNCQQVCHQTGDPWIHGDNDDDIDKKKVVDENDHRLIMTNRRERICAQQLLQFTSSPIRLHQAFLQPPRWVGATSDYKNVQMKIKSRSVFGLCKRCEARGQGRPFASRHRPFACSQQGQTW